MRISRCFWTCSLAASLTFLAPYGATALPGSETQTVTIRHDRGGVVLEYALRMKRLKARGTNVRFAGRCDSACTLYLALSKQNTCILPGASFGFHLPYGSSARGNQIVAKYMLRNYPSWARAWLAREGGLSSGIKRMSYVHASRYLRTCASSALALASAR